MSKEVDRHQDPEPHEPIEPAALPADLAAFLRTTDVACLMQESNHGTVFVVKLPASEIQNLSGRVSMRVRHELYQHPAAPVIRTVFRIYDQPDNPLGLETFTNVEQADQRDDFARLASQKNIYLLFYDEQLRHRLTKGLENVEASVIEEIVTKADALRAQVPAELYDFDSAKAEIVARTSL
jgi:hypothetical protein